MGKITSFDCLESAKKTCARARELLGCNAANSALSLLDSLSKNHRDSFEAQILYGKAFLLKNQNKKAIRHLEDAFLTARQNPELIELLIEAHEKQKQYQKVLFYLNLIFSLDIDHVPYITKVLSLYRRLGLYERARELITTIRENKMMHPSYEKEEVYLIAVSGPHLEVDKKILSSSLKTEEKKKLLREVCARVICTPLKPFFLQESVWLGSYEDKGVSKIFTTLNYTRSHFIETCIRLYDFLEFTKTPIRVIRGYKSEEDQELARILSHFFQLSKNSNSLELVLHFIWNPEAKKEEGVIHAGFIVQNNATYPLPDLAGVVTDHFHSELDLSKDGADQILAEMKSCRHVSTLTTSIAKIHTHAARIAPFHFTPFYSKEEVPLVCDSQMWWEMTKKMIQNDGFLYIEIALSAFSGTKIQQTIIAELLELHREQDFPECSVPVFCLFMQPKLCCEFYISCFKKTQNIKLAKILAQFSMQKSFDLLLELCQKQWPEKTDILETCLKKGLWRECPIQILDSFVVNPSLLLAIIDSLFEISWCPLSHAQWLFSFACQSKASVHIPIFCFLYDSGFAGKIASSSESFLQSEFSVEKCLFLLACNHQIPKNFEIQLLDACEHAKMPVILSSYLFPPHLLEKLLTLQKNSPKKITNWENVILRNGFKLSSQVFEILENRKLCEEIKFSLLILLLNNEASPKLMNLIFFDSDLRSKLALWIARNSKQCFLFCPEKDLIFLMETQENQPQAALALLQTGDMEFLPFLIHHLKSCTHELNTEIFKALYSCRSDEAIRIFFDFCLQTTMSVEQIASSLLWITEDYFRFDEWKFMVKRPEFRSRLSFLKLWMENLLNRYPELIEPYFSLFSIQDEKVILEKINLFDHPVKKLRPLTRLFRRSSLKKALDNHPSIIVKKILEEL